MDMWNFCGGYQPAVWVIYVGLHSGGDWPILINLQKTIRDHG
jgi:hypothetical protein